MLKHVLAGIFALAGLTVPVYSASTCEPAKLAAAVDRYAADPFGPRSWRVLKGLGDPTIDADYRGGDYWSAQEEWKKLAGGISPDGKYLQNFGYDCRIGYPLQVLKDRVTGLGRDSKYVKQWLRVQDTVLQACTEQGGADLKLPDPIEIEPAVAKLQADDRAYQEATVAFYRDKPRAIQLFKAIGASGSPHKASARYNVANLLANAKNLTEARAEANAILADPSLASVHGITKELLGYIANLEDTPEGWTALINATTQVIEQPLAAINASEEKKREYAFALNDIRYAGVDSKDDDWWLDGKLPENPTLSKALYDTARSNPMVLWMIAGQSGNQYYEAAPWSVIGDKWQTRLSEMTGKVLAVLVAANMPQPARDMIAALAAKPDDATRADVWEKARAAMAATQTACGDDAQTASAAFMLSQAVRLSAMAGKFEEAYGELEKVPFKGTRAYADTVLKLGQYLLGQGNVTEARSYRDRLLTADFYGQLPADGKDGYVDRFAELKGWMAEDEAHWKEALSTYSLKTSNQILNFLPGKKLWAYADDTMFSDAQRALLARAAWTRDYVLGRKISDQATAKLMSLNPRLKETANKVAADYPKANPERARLLTILRSPRYGILVTSPDIYDAIEVDRADFSEIDSYDINDKNWWCPFETDRQLGGLRSQFDSATGVGYLTDYDYGKRRMGAVLDDKVMADLGAKRDAVLKANPMVRMIDWKEIDALAAAPSGPKKLSESAVRWGKASKGDDGAPEALALAVKTTRYGCRWAGRHGEYSKAAQTLLQSKFKDTSFAKATPYWFDCMYEEWDKDSDKVAVCKPKTWTKQPPLK